MAWGDKRKEVKRIQKSVDQKLTAKSPKKLPWTTPQSHTPKKK